jgi:hypothetical protein
MPYKKKWADSATSQQALVIILVTALELPVLPVITTLAIWTSSIRSNNAKRSPVTTNNH